MAKSPHDFGVSKALWDDNTEALSQVLGFFLVTFGRLEMTITAILAFILGYEDDYERFDILARGLDAKGKVSRLRLAAKRYIKPVGENLSKALTAFTDTDCAIRNNICHTWPTLDKQGVIHFGSLSAVPDYLGRGPSRPLALDPPAHAMGHLYGRALWMHQLERDLLQVLRRRPMEFLEIDDRSLTLPPTSPGAPTRP
jgi:hypothetical protein